ncbi:MAG TPA: NADPH-dependent assimilatory sulfite reductase hemoprotein subunit [Steroidobacteraceae bacterium]|nr:NADPH-dependent assimilatory sulfite reductase hemoprotein subunit [Steroidobacteraceae bacterium]
MPNLPVGAPSLVKSKAESLKEESRNLRGGIAAELQEPSPKFSNPSAGLLKFHGMYQQEDRDARRIARQEGGDKHYMFMVRSKVPGGQLSAGQYLVHDRLAREFGNGTLRITTRQDFQIHGVLKGDLRAAVGSLNQQLITTLGACGDIARNVVTCPSPAADRVALRLQEYALAITQFAMPKGRFYHEIWLDGERITPEEPEEEPLYGRAYLPRKFKTAISFPGDNCIDVYSNDIAFVPELVDGGLAGFTLLAGGGLGMTHHKKETYPRLASPIAFITPERLLPTVEAMIGIHRDFGDRNNRRHARLKYVVEELGVPAIRAELEQRLGAHLADPKDLVWRDAADHLGWGSEGDDRWYLGLPIENGRLRDGDANETLTGLREIVSRFGYAVRLTPQQNLLLCGIPSRERPALELLLRRYGIPQAASLSGLALNALACPALPTCGLSLAESERVFPALLRDLERELIGLGLRDEQISVRMTGCPNGCARPYTSEIGFVGKTAGVYDVYAGGSFHGTRLAEVLAESVPFDKLLASLRPSLRAFREDRLPGERFGEFCARAGLSLRHELALLEA